MARYLSEVSMPAIDDAPLVHSLDHLVRHRLEQARLRPELFWPWWNQVTVKVLLVTDGLDFSDGDFGLSAFITSLLDDGRRYARFDLTLGTCAPT